METKEHMPDCPALRCVFVRPSRGKPCKNLECQHIADTGFDWNHKFQPGECDCELGKLAGWNEDLRMEIGRLEEEYDRCFERLKSVQGALILVLPMAKGYAAEHDVGNNKRIVKGAEEILEGEQTTQDTPRR